MATFVATALPRLELNSCMTEIIRNVWAHARATMLAAKPALAGSSDGGCSGEPHAGASPRHIAAWRPRGFGPRCPFVSLSLILSIAAHGVDLRVPQGFEVEKVAGAPAIQFPMFAAFDDAGRLFVTESSGKDLYAELQKLSRDCRVSMLEDKDGDGRFEHAQVFADRMVFPMGLAWREGKLYIADPPDLVTLEDTDGDGRADQRTVVLSGFGHTDNGSLHGLTFGPDGWLYMTMGQPDGYRLKRTDGSLLTGSSGALLRCRPDGRDVEMLSRGFENLVEVLFMPAGEIIGTVNWYYLPAAGVRDALVHLVEGGLYPLDAHERTESHHFNSGLIIPPLSVYPAVAHSGITLYRGDAFPGALRGNAFSAQHNTRKIVRHQFSRRGATFESSDDDFVTSDDPDFHPSDVLEDADGSLLVVDTGSWYVHHCPTGRIRHTPAEGGLYRVRYKDAPRAPDPRGLKLNWNVAAKDLAARLADGRAVVRDRAVTSLARLGHTAVDAVKPWLANGSPVPRQGAAWVLAQINDDAARAALRDLLSATNGELVTLAARALGRCHDTNAEPALLRLLQSPAPPVRLAAAEALAHCGSRNSVDPVLQALAGNADLFITHALTLALHRFATEQQLSDAVAHGQPPVQRAALVLLDQAGRKLSADAALKCLFSPDAAVRAAAQAVMRRHRDWVSQAASALRQVLSKGELSPAESEMVADFTAAFFSAPEVSTLVAKAAVDRASSPALRRHLLGAMSRVAANKWPADWRDALRAALVDDDPDLQAQGVRTVNTLQIAGLEQPLSNLARAAAKPIALRLEALRAVVRREPTLGAPEFAFLESQLSRSNSAALRVSAAEVIGAAALTETQLARFAGAVRGDSMISPGVVVAAAQRARLDAAAARALLAYLGSAVAAGTQLSEQQLKWLRAAVPASMARDVAALATQLASTQERQRAQLAELEPLLAGGDPNRGQSLFISKAGCAVCHRVGQHGGLIGPDLTRIGAIRSGRDLLESLLMPSATFAQGYDTFAVTTKGGDTLTGIRVRQPDDAVILRDATGAETRFDPAQIDSMERLNTSIMPEGLLVPLSRDEIRDLLAYLQALK